MLNLGFFNFILIIQCGVYSPSDEKLTVVSCFLGFLSVFGFFQQPDFGALQYFMRNYRLPYNLSHLKFKVHKHFPTLFIGFFDFLTDFRFWFSIFSFSIFARLQNNCFFHFFLHFFSIFFHFFQFFSTFFYFNAPARIFNVKSNILIALGRPTYLWVFVPPCDPCLSWWTGVAVFLTGWFCPTWLLKAAKAALRLSAAALDPDWSILP